MTDHPENPDKPAEADRIAKVMARAGIASRREAERMIVEGRVTVNGRKVDSPALDVMPSDKIVVDGKKLDDKQETRLWLYYKPVGLVTSEADEKGRQTIFDALPRDLPRVITVGRLDLNSEGLLLLTNDGDLKRRLELPSTGWLRRYRVRVNGNPSDLTFAPLRRGVTIDDEEFAPMEIKLDSQQGANAWLTVGIREGKNREIRRAMSHVGLQVNRLIRIGYGPFKLTGLEKNQVSEVKRRVLRDQLGGLLTGEVVEKDREMRPHGAEGPRGPRRDDRDGDRPRSFRGGGKPGGGDARGGKPWGKTDGPRGPRRDDGDGDRPRSFRSGGKPGGDDARGGKPWGKTDGPRGPRRDDGDGDRPRSFRSGGKPGGGDARGGKPWAKNDGPRGPRGDDGQQGERPRKSFGAKPTDVRGPRTEGGVSKSGGKPYDKRGDGKGFGKPGGRPGAGKPGFKGPRPEGQGEGRGRPASGRPSAKPSGRPGGKPRGPKS